MIELEQLKVKNFRSFGSKWQSIQLNNLGLTLLVGKNKDSFQSNGAGKSSLLNAIVYALYNATSDGVKGNSLVNNKIGHDMGVQLSFKDGKNEYLIKRYRKDRKYKNKTFLYRNDKNITQRSIKKTNELIQSIVGIDYQTYLHSYMFNGMSAHFASLTDRGKKKILDDMINVSIYPVAREISKDDAKRTSDQMDNINSKIDATKYSLTNLAQLQSSVFKSNKDRANHIQSIQNSLIKQKKQCLIDSQNVNKYSLNLKRATKQFNNVRAEYHKYGSALKKVTDMENRVANCKTRIQHFTTQLQNATNQIKSDKQKIIAITTGKQKTCYWCGQVLNKQHRHTESVRLAEDIVSVNKVASHVTKSLKVAKQYLDQAKSDVIKAKTNVPDTSKLNDKLNRLTSIQDKNKNALTKVEINRTKLHSLRKQYKELQQNKHVDYSKKMGDLVSKFKKQSHTLKKLKIRYKLYNESKDIYSNSGIRSMVLDLILPFINKQANHYLQILTSGSISLLIVPTTTSKSTGNTSEKINMKINNSHGATSYKDLSAGEQRRVDLSIILSLNDYTMSKASTSFNFECFDELFEHLDSSSYQVIAKILMERQKKIPNIIVVTHQPELQRYFPSRIIVCKHHGFSTIK